MTSAGRDPIPIEAELRLAGDPKILKAVFASPCLAPAPGVEEKASDLESRYFDTADLDLRARGLAFRVRANGKGYRQTLKAGDDAKGALLKRGEWESVLEDDRPRPDALPKAARERLPKAAFKSGLRQAFVTRVSRRMREVSTPGGVRIETALDLGEIEADGVRLPIAEIELELLEGQPEALYGLALELQKIGPLRLETRSKSARAFDGLANRPPSWQRATKPSFAPEHSTDQAMARIFESCFEQWLANQAAAIDGRDPEGVHQMRVALRRLRSALSVFRRLIPEDQLAWLGPAAKQAIGALGPARDWDVFQADLLPPVMRAQPDDESLTALQARARTRGRAVYRHARKHLESPDYTRFVLQFGHWLERRAWRDGDTAGREALREQPIASFAAKLLTKRRKRVLAKGRGFEGLSTARRHELRIALKKLRYGIEFIQPAFDRKSLKPFLRNVKTLQEKLGLLNDVAVAEGLLAELLRHPGKRDIRTAAGLVIGWHARGIADSETDLRRAWAAFETEPAFWR